MLTAERPAERVRRAGVGSRAAIDPVDRVGSRVSALDADADADGDCDGAIETLRARLGASIRTLAGEAPVAGDSQALAGALNDIVQATRGHRLGMPSRQVGLIVAKRFLDGASLSDAERDTLAWVICEPIEGAGAESVCAAGKRLGTLLTSYRDDARRAALPRMTWFGLFATSMAFDPQDASAAARAGWKALRATLRETWPQLEFPPGWAPDWLRALKDFPQLLSNSPCEDFIGDCLRGSDIRLRRISQELGVPSNSWFWADLQRTTVDHALRRDDRGLREALGALVNMLRERATSARDGALRRLLERLALGRDRSVPATLRDFVFSRSVWKSPRLRGAGAAPAWHGVSEAAWRMAMGWLSDAHQRLFFDKLLVANDADEGRREFWSHYTNRISGCRLAAGADTIERARSHAPLARALAEPGADLAVITGRWKAVDALMIEIGDYVFVETSVKGSTCYAYPRDNLPFDPNAPSYDGGVSDLGAGYYHRGEPRDLRFPREAGWQAPMAQALSKLGIEQDR